MEALHNRRNTIHPEEIKMEHNQWRWMEDDVPFFEVG